MIQFDTQVRVWYEHTDQMGICHHSNYINYYEAARSDFMRSLGLSYAEVERMGLMMPILEVQAKYHRPARYDELLTVRVLLDELPTTRVNFRYELYNEEGTLINRGMTQLGFMRADTRRPCRCPEWFLDRLRTVWSE